MMLTGRMAAIPAPSGEDRQGLPAVAALLRRIDDLPPHANGALVFDDPSQGIVLVEGGRVCWAAAPTLRTRLTDRLRNATQLDGAEWEAVFRECVDTRVPLGQTLVRQGLLSGSLLRRALLEHTSEALAQLAKSSREPRWLLSSERRYDAEFTFAPVELLVHAGDSQWGPLAQLARDTLETLLENGGYGCAFVVCDGVLLPFGMHGLETLGASVLLELSEWAYRFLGNASAAAATAHVAALLRDDGPSAVVWKSDGIHYAALCTERSDLVNILVHLRRGRNEEDTH